ncbi:MAG TPA: hypothetical protein VHP33_26220 [Polyangiaceae bacterium]|nr:hypothetical protein [Polyangiaceae bacterium]
MTQLRFIPAAFSASAVFLFSSLSFALQAPAPGCGKGPACEAGFECAVVGASGCAGTEPCAPGSSCPEPEPCTTVEEYGCVPAHCTQDAECAPGMVCHAWTEDCPVTDCACAPDVPDCGCGAPSQCDPKTVSVCTPRYVLPCKVDSDCGTNFTCKEEIDGCASSGSGGSDAPAPNPGGSGAKPLPPDAGGAPAADPIPVPNCNAQPTGNFRCFAKDIVCDDASDCPTGWHCEQAVNVTSPTCPPGAECEPAAEPIPAASLCRPDYYGVDSSGGLETPTAGNDKGESTSGSAGSTSTGTPTPQPTAPNAADGDAESHESAACAMGHAPASSGALSILVMLGALFGLKRRRAQG